VCVVSDASSSTPEARARCVVLLSGAGTLLQALLDASADPAYGAGVVAVGSDRDGVAGLERARSAGVETFVVHPASCPDRSAWDLALTGEVARFAPDLVVCAGFMRLLGPAFLASFGGRTLNSHPALLPAFPGMHGPRDALAYGVKITGATVFLVDAGVDTGVIVDQVAVPVEESDSVAILHERIKTAERRLLTETVHRLATRPWRVLDRKVLWQPASQSRQSISEGPTSEGTDD
jgi:phosphoribosylglycinamide formyltransferase 1